MTDITIARNDRRAKSSEANEVKKSSSLPAAGSSGIPKQSVNHAAAHNMRPSDNKNEYNFHIIAPAPVVPISFRE